MVEYIDREAVMERIAAEKDDASKMFGIKSKYEGGYLMGYYNGLTMAYTITLNTTAADVAPVVRSEWEILTDDSGNEYMRCKQCGEEFYDGDNDTVDTKHNFCPNCGADMREG